MTRELFTTSLAYLQKMYGKSLDKDIIKIYWVRFKDVDDTEWKKAVQNVMDSFTPSAQVPFPLVPHFLKATGKDSHYLGVRAITKIQEAISKCGSGDSVNFGDRALHSVIERYGGWGEVCNWSYEDWRMKERLFIEAYEAAHLSNDSGPKYMVGRHELNNTANGFLKFIEPPKWFGDGPELMIENKREDTASNVSDITNLIADKMGMENE